MIPHELRALPQWVCATKDDRRPIDPKTGRLASVTNPDTWGTFEQALAYAKHMPNGCVGFVLTEADPYVIIDLDDKPEKPATETDKERHRKIIEAACSYTERSISGRGYHIIVKGHIPAGVKRDTVEMYGASRYMILTGDQINDYPIVEAQPLLDVLYEEMAPRVVVDNTIQEEQATRDDEAIIAELRANAKFRRLFYDGDWHALGYPSQSEADMALMTLITQKTKNREQATRIFLQSALGKRKKAHRKDYQKRLFDKALHVTIPPQVDISAILTEMPDFVPREEQVRPYPTPPGVLGAIQTYIYETAPRPIKEIALAGAIAVGCALTQRGWHYRNVGLNTYNLLLAPTGIGKEAAREGAKRLIDAITELVPAAVDLLQPVSFASVPAILRTMAASPALFALHGEYTGEFSRLVDPRPDSHGGQLAAMLMELYTQATPVGRLPMRVYAQSEKDTGALKSPAFSFLGDTTPEAFFEKVTKDTLRSGLIPRFDLYLYTGERPPLHFSENLTPDAAIVERLADVAYHSLDNQAREQMVGVTATPQAQALLDDYHAELDRRYNEAQSDSLEQHLITRMGMRVMKHAAIAALLDYPDEALIRPQHAQYAIDLVEAQFDHVTHYHKVYGIEGLTSENDEMQQRFIDLLRDAMAKYPKTKRTKNAKVLGIPGPLQSSDDHRIVTSRYIATYIRKRAPFRKMAPRLFDQYFEEFCDFAEDIGLFTQADPEQYGIRRNFKGKLFVVNFEILDLF